MISKPAYERRFRSAQKRFLQASIAGFLDREFPKMFGPVIREKMAEKIVELVDKQLPHKDYLRPGQCVWNAVSKDTRPDSPNCRMVPVVLTLTNHADTEQLAQGTHMSVIARQAVARICQEAFEQGALLSMRDIGLLIWRNDSQVSTIRKKWEEDQHKQLPFVGTIQDFGSCISHKTSIVRKVVFEGKDPRRVADETKHTQRAVDRYLKDFYRVRTCYEHMPSRELVIRTTGLSGFLVDQYIDIIKENENTITKTA